MNTYGYIDDILQTRDVSTIFTKLTVGEVVDTNDPQQMGRLRVVCPSLGDTPYTAIKDLPWATYVSPFGGIVDTGTRGRSEDEAVGPVAYGLWNIPKVGSTVLIACIDGDTRFRVWMGCLHGQFMSHTMPHGRYDYTDAENVPAGPLSSTEDPIQPLYDDQTTAFSKSKDTISAGLPNTPRQSYEYRTRGADFTSTALNDNLMGSEECNVSNKPDNQNVSVEENDGNSLNITQGYAESRVEPPLSFEATNNKNYDPQVYNWTTPGFHSISMDDRPENCRIRVRSTHGHQVILDDTNERIYVSTSQGDSWIELDEKGNIDIYGKRNVSVHAEKDINFTADEAFRVKAKSIHLAADEDVRLHSKSDMYIKSDGNTVLNSVGSTKVKSDSGVLYLNSGAQMNIYADGDIVLTAGPNFHINGIPADPGNSLPTKEAFYTSRIPEHEPWSRVMTSATVTDNDTGNTHANAAEYSYNDKDVGRIERGDSLNRNDNWHR